MGKLAQSTSKYTIIAKFNSEGTVEKPDVIGALFGQTEGLLGQDMDLRELQKTGRIGRIDVELVMKTGKASGEISIPSSLDSSETALIAACIETIERVGPCNAKIIVENIEDVRVSKRKYIMERAKELLGKMFQDTMETQEMTDQIKESIRSAEVVQWRGLPAGPAVNQSDNIVIVEGRADVINLLRCGIKNVVAIEGTSVPPQIADLAKEKEITAFLDGDRGGDLILRELTAVAEVDFVARAPEEKEVEELTKKEIIPPLPFL
ncbi:MAG TPA: DNA primase DnaG, partial [archaeon]|nr:DNA primase DnaG [archaeon]